MVCSLPGNANGTAESICMVQIHTATSLGRLLAPSNFDALPVIRARGGLKTERTQMAFFRESMIIKEEDMQEIDRIKDENAPYLAGALVSIYDDTNTLIRGAEVVPERMRMPNGIILDLEIACKETKLIGLK